MSYVESTLLPGEKIILKGQIHWIVFFPAVVIWCLTFFVYFKMTQGAGHYSGGVFTYHEMAGAATYSYQQMAYSKIFVALFLLMAVIETSKKLIYFFATEFAITDKRVIAKLGFIKRDTYELNINRVTSLNVDQSVLGRMLDYGNITVVSMGGSFAPIRAVVDPLRFRRVLLGEVEGIKLS